MNKKQVGLIVLSIIIIGIVISTILSKQQKSFQKKQTGNQLPKEEVLVVKQKSYPVEITLSGFLYALNKINLYSEVTGVMQQNSQKFREGNDFIKNEPLLYIRNKEYRNNLLSNKSNLMNQIASILPDLRIDYPESVEKWKNYLSEFKLEQDLPSLPEPGSSQEKYFLAARNIYSQYYQIKSMEVRLDKYIIRAPFNGSLTQSLVNPGNMIRAGQKIGEYISTDIYEMEAFTSLQDISKIKQGKQVILTCGAIPGQFQGEISRINAEIDNSSQTIKVYITTKDKRLRDGLYMQAHIKLKSPPNSARIPQTAVTNNKVWVVKDSVLSRKNIRIYDEQEEHFIVTELADDTKIVKHSKNNFREAMKIKPVHIPQQK